MSTKVLKELMQKAETLTADEQMLLAARLVERARQAQARSGHTARWGDLYGRAAGPLAGEDAQAWVSRTRREADEHRSQPRTAS